MTQQEAVNILLRQPSELGKLIGFDKLTDIHNKWIKSMVLETKDHTLQAHRGSYKTTCVTIALPILMILKPNNPIVFIRKTNTSVKEIVRQIAKILRTDEFRYLVKCIWDIDFQITTENQTELSTNLNTSISGTNQLTAFGIDGAITGKHYDYIFTDDIVTKEDRISKAERDSTKIVYQELHNIINRGGRIYNTGTPWHPDDCFTLMPTPEKYDCYNTGIISDTELKTLKDSMENSLFAANYELRHIAAEDIIFQDPKYSDDLYRTEQGVGHIDAAYGGEDYTAFTIVKKYNDKFYVYGKLWRKNIVDVEDTILALAKSKMCGKIYNEINADKGFLGRDLEAKGARIELYHESENKYVKIVSFLKAAWKDIIFTTDTDKEYINQICDYNEKSEHDDAPDSLASLMRVLNDNKYKTFSFD